ncbi:hypothetical protein BDV26DRAFT_256596 [Aspergillus bertholletiae]|uniref:Uncharacterized protein n=1 Tax=Aspergillus bertholletiae TaxID=1226010 RepID=A0A5N7BG90_9EURO|nr:hypothetical protein BDV26DRAFT_256596 [Aspergillus bertholletiae]
MWSWFQRVGVMRELALPLLCSFTMCFYTMFYCPPSRRLYYHVEASGARPRRFPSLL